MSSKLYAPCFLCINIAKWIPVLFITATVMWSYYAYVVEFNLYTLELIFKKVVYLFLYHIFLVLFLWTYWQTIFTESGKVPRQFRLPASELELYLNAETEELRRETLETFCQRQLLPVTNRTLTGDVRYCDKCHHIKPDRCHHCSVCGACILKMDHHCPWVNNCVSYSNYKFFVLFLGYAFLYCLFVAATTLEYFIRFWSRDIDSGNNKFQVLLLFFVSMMFGICLVSLLGYHIFLVTKNRSTIESFRGPIFWVNRTWIHDKEGFSLGSYNNFLEVFGDDKKLWFLPIFTSAGDGTSFPLRNKPPPLDNYCSSPSSQFSNCSLPPVVSSSYGSTSTSLGDGISYPQRCVSEDSDGLLRSHHGGGCGVDRWSEDEEPDLTEVMVQPAQSFNV